ncbi:hypothetical protein ACVNPS_09070 [Candidatus Bipolaricaulota sp. J31]
MKYLNTTLTKTPWVMLVFHLLAFTYTEFVTLASTNKEEVIATEIDNKGNVYVTGHILKSRGDWDVFLRKFSSNGELLWEEIFGTSQDEWATGISINSEGNIYVIGCTMGIFPGYEELSGSLPSIDGFLCKFTSAGKICWIRQFGARISWLLDDIWLPHQDIPIVVMCPNNSIYIVTDIVINIMRYSSIKFGPESEQEFGESYFAYPVGTFYPSLIKFNSEGKMLWECRLAENGTVKSIIMDIHENIFILMEEFASPATIWGGWLEELQGTEKILKIDPWGRKSELDFP